MSRVSISKNPILFTGTHCHPQVRIDNTAISYPLKAQYSFFLQIASDEVKFRNLTWLTLSKNYTLLVVPAIRVLMGGVQDLNESSMSPEFDKKSKKEIRRKTIIIQ